MASKQRLDNFKGTGAGYVLYLERQLREARDQIDRLKSKLRLLDYPDSCPQDFLDPIPDNAALSIIDNTAISAPASENHVSNTQDKSTRNRPIHLRVVDTLEVIPYEFTRAKTRKQNPAWRQELDCFLGNIPIASLWLIRREELQLSSVRMNQVALVILLRGARSFGLPSDELTPLHHSLSSDAILKILSIYAPEIKTSQGLAKAAAQLAQFLGLIFASMCKVFLYLRYPITVVHEKMSEAFGSRHSKSLDRLIRGGDWANRCISWLFDNKWTHRSTEAFFLFGRPLEFYARVSDYKDSTTLLKEHLKAPEYGMFPDVEPRWIPYSIPSIIKVLVGDILTLSKICTHLGYSKEYSEACTDLPDKYQLLFKQGNMPSILVKDQRPRLVMDGDGARNGDSSADAIRDVEGGSSTIQVDTDRLSANQTLCENEQDCPVDRGSLKRTWDQSLTEDANLPLMSPLLAENPHPLLEALPFDMSSMMNLGFDISHILEIEVDMSTTIQQGYSTSPTSTEHIVAQSY